MTTGTGTPAGPAAEKPSSTITRGTFVRLAVGVLLAAGVLVVVSTLASDVPDAADLLRTASLPWLAAGVGLQVANYMLLSYQVSRLVGGQPIMRKSVGARVALVVYGFGTLLPGAPAPGMVIAGRELARRGVEPARAALAFFLAAWFNLRAFLVLLVLTAVLAVLRGRVPNDSRFAVIGGAAFVAASLALSALLVKRPGLADRLGWGLERLDWRPGRSRARETTVRLHAEARDAVSSSRRGFRIATATFGSRLADALCLRFALLSVGVHISMGVVLIAYVVSILVSIVPLLPGGLGLVEASVPGVLNYYGVPLDAAVAGTLAWRMLTLLLPAAAGLMAYVSLRTKETNGGQGVDPDSLSLPAPP